MSYETASPGAPVLRPSDRQNIALPPIGSSPDVMESYALMQGLLRDIRAEVQNLQRILTEILAREDMADTDLRAEEILQTVKTNQSIYDYNAGEINRRLVDLRSLLNTRAMLYDRYGDEITHIENYWERATYRWPHVTDIPTASAPSTQGEATAGDAAVIGTNTTPTKSEMAAEVLRSARGVQDDLNNLIYHVGLLTIPSRLNQHLEQLRIGQALDFDKTFGDEIPRDEDRLKILAYLASRPIAISNGVIDVPSRRVYHASPSIRRRRASFGYILLTVLIGAVITWAIAEAPRLFDLEDWPVNPDQTINLLVGYAFVMIGGFIHVGVDAIKQARNQQGQPTGFSFLALEDGLLWIHVNEVGLIIGTLSMWVVYFGLLFTTGSVNWETAFLIGYSTDSFIDMFLQRFDTSVERRVATISI